MQQPPPGSESSTTGGKAAERAASPRRGGWARVGVLLILLSGLLWAPLPVIPFLPLKTSHKLALAGVLFAGVQIAWWTGAALAGPEAVRRIRGWLSGWRPRRTAERAEADMPDE